MSEAEFKLEIQEPELDRKFMARRKARLIELGLHPTRPYRLKEQPTLISFSGGSSSGYMLWHILEEFGGKFPEWIQVIFSNTSEELPQTFDFVQKFTDELGVPITWLERSPEKTNLPAQLRIVDRDSAECFTGKVFDGWLAKKTTLPNVGKRLCTIELKVNLSHSYAKHVLGWDKYTSVIGFRGDEPKRYIDLFECDSKGKDKWAKAGLPPQCPMVRAQVSKRMVDEFWAKQPWKLGIESWEGNCIACFLKGKRTLVAIARKYPEVMKRWRDREEKMSHIVKLEQFGRFNVKYTVDDIIETANSQIDLEDIEDDRTEDCHCHN